MLTGALDGATSAPCLQPEQASWQTLYVEISGGNRALHYYSTRLAGQTSDTATSALIAVHGYLHDANATFAAAVQAAQAAGVLASTLVVAPLFQVDPTEAAKHKPCTTQGVPGPRPGDLTWTCGGWSDGAVADGPGGALTAYAAMDRLLARIVAMNPSVATITVAGFSDGAQMVQHYAALATPPAGRAVRFIVSDPGSWLYFDPNRPYPTVGGKPVPWSRCDHARNDGLGDCALSLLLPANPPRGWSAPRACAAAGWQAQSNRWKYGTEHMPRTIGRSPDAMRQAYRSAEISYLLGRDDDRSGMGPSVFDTSCAAELEGSFRLQRGLGYAEYDRTKLNGTKHGVMVVHGCGHDVCCVFTSTEARPALFPAEPR